MYWKNNYYIIKLRDIIENSEVIIYSISLVRKLGLLEQIEILEAQESI